MLRARPAPLALADRPTPLGAVRRLAGPVAPITAAAVLAASPVTVALNRGNVAGSLLIMLLVLAADATSLLMVARVRTRASSGSTPTPRSPGTAAAAKSSTSTALHECTPSPG